MTNRQTVRNFPSALQFAGTNASTVTVAHASNLNVTTDFTLAAWVKPISLASVNRVIEKNYTLAITTSGKLRCTLPSVADIDDTGSNVVRTGQWNHIAITHTGTSFKFYINGVLNSAVTNAGVTPTATSSLRISANTEQFNGRGAEVLGSIGGCK
jgi:hypothetical protein